MDYNARTIGAVLGGLLLVGTVVGVGVAVGSPDPAAAWQEINDTILPALSAEDGARTQVESAQAQVAAAQAALTEAQAVATEAAAALATATTAADAAEARLGELADVPLPPEQADSAQMQEIRRLLEKRHGGQP